MNKKLVLIHLSLAVILVIAVSCSNRNKSSDAKPTAAGDSASGKSNHVTIADQLRTPWAIQFDGETIYVSERVGNIVKIEGDASVRQPVRLNKKVNEKGEGGFLGLVLSPDFKENRQAYAYHTYEEDGETYNRVVLMQETAEGWNEIKAYLERIPGSNNHNGGRLAIGPDHNLYITTGDTYHEELAQNLNTTAGKILRMSLDGKIPKDNPFPGSYVYSYGHRNSQGMAWDAQGRMYSSEHGPSGSPGGHDEINLIEPGNNYGWPRIIGDEKYQGMINPLYHTGDEAIAPSGIAVDSDNNVLIAALRGEKLYTYSPKTKTMETVLENEGRIRDVKIHNGDIYVITNNTDGRGKPSKIDDRLLMLK